MVLRVARHTDHLELVVKFYTEVMGLDIIGDFKNHEGYDGVFLGKESLDWHLEFTTSDEKAVHQPDADDLLVFYPQTREEYDRLIERITAHNVPRAQAKNPYWNLHGVLILGPDGFGIVISDLRIKLQK